MKNLKTDWLTHGLIDFEYKKYELLAYLSNVNKSFSESKLYPFLSDLIFHYNNIISIKESKKLWYEQFPGLIKGIDLKRLKISYEKIVNDDQMMQELEEIMDFAIPRIKKAVSEGTEIYDYVESMVEVTPVGLSPIYKNEGYVFILEEPKKNMKVYRYGLKFFKNSSDKYRGIEMNFVENRRYLKFRTFENEKLEIVKKYGDLPNPATFLVTSQSVFPLEETLLPISKRYLVRYISRS